MNRSEFDALPVAVQLRLVLEAFPAVERAVLSFPVPESPPRPKYDERIRRVGGFQWASESDLDSIRFFHQRATSSTNEAFAERNIREAVALARWLHWREYHPTSIWEGERSRVKVTAHPPSSKPELHRWEVRDTASPALTDGKATSNVTSINLRALDGDDSADFEEEEESVINGF